MGCARATGRVQRCSEAWYSLQTPHKCVVSEKTRKCTDISGAKAVYDYDKCQGHGPETMTIRRFMKGTYNFFLVQDSRWGKITECSLAVNDVGARLDCRL